MKDLLDAYGVWELINIGYDESKDEDTMKQNWRNALEKVRPKILISIVNHPSSFKCFHV